MFKSFVIMIVKYQWVLSGTFAINFFLVVDQWKVFIKIKIKLVFGPIFYYLDPHF